MGGAAHRRWAWALAATAVVQGKIGDDAIAAAIAADATGATCFGAEGTARLEDPGQGFACVQEVLEAVGFVAARR